MMRWRGILVFTGGGIVLAGAPVSAVPMMPIDQAVEWVFVVILCGAGGLGALARVLSTTEHSIPLGRVHFGQFLAGIVAALVVGFVLADIPWFREMPRTVIGLSALAGWVGTTLLDRLGGRLVERVAALDLQDRKEDE